MTFFLVPVRPVVLALIIGLFDLFLGETLKHSVDQARSWHRRRTLFDRGCYEVLTPRARTWAHAVQSPSFIIGLLQVLLLALCIWLELSIDNTSFPAAAGTVTELCFTPMRATRAISKGGPREPEMYDDRVRTYLEQSGCNRGGSDAALLSTALAGPDALSRGYPTCHAFGPGDDGDDVDEDGMTMIEENLVLQGGGNAYVANSLAGDSHLVYGLEDLRNPGTVQNEDIGVNFTSTSFWHLGLGSHNLSFPKWTKQDTAQRIIGNVALPNNLVDTPPADDEFNATARGEVRCDGMDETCYRNFSRNALKLTDTVETQLTETVSGGYFIRVHKSEEVPDFVCIFGSGGDSGGEVDGEGDGREQRRSNAQLRQSENENDRPNNMTVTVTVQWGFMSMYIPGIERNRSGPTPLRIQVRGRAFCAWGMNSSVNGARVYLDAMEYIDMRKIDLHKLDPILFSSSSSPSPVNIISSNTTTDNNNTAPDVFTTKMWQTVLNTAAVTMGMKTIETNGAPCAVRPVTHGSSMGRPEALASGMLIALIVLVTLLSLASALRDRCNCPLQDDPLGTLALLRQLRRHGPAGGGGGRKFYYRGGEEGLGGDGDDCHEGGVRVGIGAGVEIAIDVERKGYDEMKLGDTFGKPPAPAMVMDKENKVKVEATKKEGDEHDTEIESDSPGFGGAKLTPPAQTSPESRSADVLNDNASQNGGRRKQSYRPRQSLPEEDQYDGMLRTLSAWRMMLRYLCSSSGSCNAGGGGGDAVCAGGGDGGIGNGSNGRVRLHDDGKEEDEDAYMVYLKRAGRGYMLEVSSRAVVGSGRCGGPGAGAGVGGSGSGAGGGGSFAGGGASVGVGAGMGVSRHGRAGSRGRTRAMSHRSSAV